MQAVKVNMYIWWLVEMHFSQKSATIANSWGPATQLDTCIIYLAMTSKPEGINRGKIFVAFH